uniref:Uncharacterized protein n=1 Tax=Leersia perrieri TaxID=77586 RepID=A0A0D9WRU6_9ORYZ
MEGESPEIMPVECPDQEPASSKSDDVPPVALSSRLPIPSGELSLYRAAVALRLVLLAAFFHYRVTHPVAAAADGHALWLTSVSCELWLAASWLISHLPKLSPANRATYPDMLAAVPSGLAGVDVFVSAAGTLATANAVLSVLAADYPAGGMSCYVHDDGADVAVFESLFEAARFARRWVPFCRRHGVVPRAPELYFARGVDYLRDRAAPSFVKDRRAMKREYEELKVRMNCLAAKASKAAEEEEGWVMSDGAAWPGNNPRDHPAMIQVMLGHPGDRDVDGGELPRLFYVSREKRPGFRHHGKAGAMNALLRVSAVLSNSAYVLNLDSDQCVNNSSVLREAMCFLMDPVAGNRTCFVQFALRDADDGDSVFSDIEMKCLDGIQGPVYLGSGCCFSRKALYGFEPAAADDGDDDTEMAANWWTFCFGRGKRMSWLRRSMSAVPLLDSDSEEDDSDDDEQEAAAAAAGRRRSRRLRAYRASLERHFGQSPAFIASAFEDQGRRRGDGGEQDAAVAGTGSLLLKEAIHVVSCAYEQSTRWGKDIGWMYVGGDGDGGNGVATGFRMHARGWSSAYCSPTRPAFRSFTKASPSEHLAGASRGAVAAMAILLSRRHCPIWAGWAGGGGRIRLLQRVGYVGRVAYPLASIPLTVYCFLPAVCLLTGKSTFPADVTYYDGVLLILLLSSVAASVALELRWSRVSLHAWWRGEKMWVVTATSACLAAVFQGVLAACTGMEIGFSTETTPAASPPAGEEEEAVAWSVRWTKLVVLPASVAAANLAGVVGAVAYGVDHGYDSWGPLGAKLVLAGWVVAHLQGFLRGVIVARRERGRAPPTIAVLWSVLFVSVVSLLWVHLASFSASPPPPTAQQPIL